MNSIKFYSKRHFDCIHGYNICTASVTCFGLSYMLIAICGCYKCLVDCLYCFIILKCLTKPLEVIAITVQCHV